MTSPDPRFLSGGRDEPPPVLNEGDIYHWRWTPEREARMADTWGRGYHCRSRIAVVKGGVLRDTYWGSSSDGWLDLSEVVLEFQGNPAQMKQIEPSERVFYRPDDLVDMRHSNNSGAPVYVKAGASRHAETMLEFYRYELEQERRDIEWAHRHIAEFTNAIAKIERGEIDGDFPIYTRRRP